MPLCLLGRKGEAGLGSLTALNTLFIHGLHGEAEFWHFSCALRIAGILELGPAENEYVTCYQGLTTEIKSP